MSAQRSASCSCTTTIPLVEPGLAACGSARKLSRESHVASIRAFSQAHPPGSTSGKQGITPREQPFQSDNGLKGMRTSATHVLPSLRKADVPWSKRTLSWTPSSPTPLLLRRVARDPTSFTTWTTAS